MTNNYLRPPAHRMFVQCFRAPARFALGTFATAWLISQLADEVAASRRRTGLSRRGNAVKSSSRSRVVIAILVVVGVIAVAAMLVVRWQSPVTNPGTANSGATTFPAQPPQDLEVWRRPATTDPREFAMAYARAIWTYDTTRHSYTDWQNAISVYADPASAAPQVAASLLPQWAEWDQLRTHKARATATVVTLEVTPEPKAMASRGESPAGWHAYVAHGKQTVVTDSGTRFLDRKAAVAVVCTPVCKFWSATAQVSP